MTGRRSSGLVLLAALAFLLAASSAARGQYQPRLRFRVLETPHFRIYFHQGEEALARRLARIAESERSSLARAMLLRAPKMTHVVLTNQDDEANGLATPLPFCTVRISAAWPSPSDLIGNTDDWLRLVFVHEYVHILQLDQSAGWSTAARTLLGRSPWAFPNLLLPEWQVEGLATYWETRATGFGRLAGGDSADIVRARASAPGGERLGRVNGGSVEWPAGDAPYLEGAWFYDYLTKRFGDDAVARLDRATAGRIPYMVSPVVTRTFGKPLGELWTEFQQQVRAEAARLPLTASTGRRLTSLGFVISSPRFDEKRGDLVFSVRDADRFPSVVSLDLASGAMRPLAHRLGGTQLTVRGGLVVFDRLDLSDSVAWRSDLFAFDRGTGRLVRLTRDARLVDPDLSADGTTLACVRIGEDGRRELAFFSVSRGAGGKPSLASSAGAVAPDPEATYGAPRWSPGGRRVVVERRRVGGPSEIVVVDLADGRQQIVAASEGPRNLEPTWAPDGDTILFASDRFADSFQIFAVSADGAALRRVTAVVGGARYPEIAPDGRHLVYVGSGPGGYDLFEIPLDPSRWEPVAPEPLPAKTPAPNSGPGGDENTTGPSPDVVLSAYSPLPTMMPRGWSPLADISNSRVRAGFEVGGSDVLLRQAFDLAVLWRWEQTTAVGGAHPGRPDWAGVYTYSRWRPALFVGASDKTSFLAIGSTGGLPLPDAELREQQVTAGVVLPVRHVEYAEAWQAALDVERLTLDTAEASLSVKRNALRLSWAIDTAKVYARSISPEDGVAAAVTSEHVRAAFGADGNADAFTGELRAYLRPVAGHSVLALRGGYGVATGDANVRREFYLGGMSASGALVDFGSDAFRMLRGFDNQVVGGSHVAVATAEWRQPVYRVERGWGTYPVYLNAIHVAAFVDAGDAWDTGFSASRLKTAVGLEGSVDLVAGYHLPLTLTAGVAATRDGAAGGRRGTGVYVRLGPSF